MKSFGTATALLLVAIISECSSAQSDRTRQRSGPIRSVPVAADIKRDVDFDCPEEFGYYPHPRDCTLYYVCVFGGALLESCTGGLMYSHELQTCDWPRNVGCDGSSSAVADDELERISEREPPSPPPRRTPPPPPQRVQPNPVVTSRGQPKFSRDEYEKQQQLYAEVDDLPPVDEIENDRQQRVYRGQPSTIGQVQKDRDGYSQVNPGRNLNSNIIPASLSQNNGKIGSFSFGTQVDERRTATVTQAPQTYSEDKRDNVTDYFDRLFDIETNDITVNEVIEKPLVRRKRDLLGVNVGSNGTDHISDRISNDEEIEYVEFDSEGVPPYGDERGEDEIERGKRQIRYIFKNGNKHSGKNWGVPKQVKLVDYRHLDYNPNVQNVRHQINYDGLITNKLPEVTQNPHLSESASPVSNFYLYQTDDLRSHRPFRPSLPDLSKAKQQNLNHHATNIATQIITKSPPISSLKNFENPFSSLAGGFFNNGHRNNKELENTQRSPAFYNSFGKQQNHAAYYPDSSNLPSTIVTGKPISTSTSSYNKEKSKLRQQEVHNSKENSQPDNHKVRTNPVRLRPQSEEEDYDENEESNENEEESAENESNEKETDDDSFKADFPEPPYEFTHPSHKFKDIENPFANPNFDFDAFLSKLSGGQYYVTPKPPNNINHESNHASIKTAPVHGSESHSSTLNYKGMSTPRPFKDVPQSVVINRPSESKQNVLVESWSQSPPMQQFSQQSHTQETYKPLNPIKYQSIQQNAGIPIESQRPRLKPPNFKDDRQLPINYSFNNPIRSSHIDNHSNTKDKKAQIFAVTSQPYVVVTGTGPPMLLSSPKYIMQTNKYATPRPHLNPTEKPYIMSSVKPNNAYIIFKHSTPKPLTTVANEQLSALQHYWSSTPSSGSLIHIRPSLNPDTLTKLEHLFQQNGIKSNFSKNSNSTAKRKPIPKPSPEMNDYYYDEYEDDYYEPPVKSKYMPSTEVRPQRPPMAQNYKEYDDSLDNSSNHASKNTQNNQSIRVNERFTTRRPESITKNYNDVSIITKGSIKDHNKNRIPVLVNYATPASTVLMRPEVSNYEIIHHSPRNKTVHIRKPMTHGDIGPFTSKPPKYLNQTTLRPYTVRHRLARPTPTSIPMIQNNDFKQMRGRFRHQNIVAQMKNTTPRDNHNQETRYTKTKHDDKTNSLEPTESVTPVSYSASPRPKMLYNGSQNYNPDQYDPYYAVYDEDGELYKDADYVQQYNTASLRPAVQQTYRGTPPPARRPVDTYSPRPVSSDDYDDALIQGQINNQNQYQSAIRHSTRGDGNELGYDHNPSSVKTTLYEAIPISTTPSTTTSTSTTTTTQRTTTAPFTEAMTPSRYTSRSSTNENPKHSPEPFQDQNSTDESNITKSSSLTSINLSSLAKPFEKTENSHRLTETLLNPERLPNPKQSTITTTNRQNSEIVQIPTDKNKSVLSLTTGFSIRRNLNNTNNPYTLTVLTRPFDNYERSRNPSSQSKDKINVERSGQYYQPDDDNKSLKTQNYELPLENKPLGDSENEKDDENIKPILIKPKGRRPSPKIRLSFSTEPTTTAGTTKYYLKTVVKRPAANNNNQNILDSTENSVSTDSSLGIETDNTNMLRNSKDILLDAKEIHPTPSYEALPGQWDNAVVSPYKSLESLRNIHDNNDNLFQDSTISSTTPLSSSSSRNLRVEKPRSKSSYYSYKIEDESVPDQTTEVFSGKVKNVLKAFFNNFVSTPTPRLLEEFSITTVRSTPQPEEKIVNIGFQKKMLKYVDDKPIKSNVKRLEIITEPTVNKFISSDDILSKTESHSNNDFSSTPFPRTTTRTSSVTIPSTNAVMIESSTNNAYFNNLSFRQPFESRFTGISNKKTAKEEEKSRKFQKLIESIPTDNFDYDRTAKLNDDKITTVRSSIDFTRPLPDVDWNEQTDTSINQIASTTSTTKATSTIRVEPTYSTKSLSFPTRASRVNPAIKLAATIPGGGRRSYQTSSKCSSDNSLQANPKCNEIRYQRPSNTRGRGSAHYSTASDGSQPIPNRGTPPTRSRPTLKPSTAIVSKSTEFVDIYTNPPSRPAPVYPQPTPDKTAAKCRKDVCLLPDCYCGGKDIPGNLPVNEVPQIVLVTFDDAVNDLNKMYYEELFQRGRANPNGCPITATFYVSHEWTDYSQVQNLYGDGHEFASHTVSHSFGEQFSQKKWNREVGGQREILAAYGGVNLDDVRGMRAPFLSVGGNKMFKMLYDSNFTYDSSLPVYENRPPSWPYTLDYKLFHDCMIPPCPTKSYPGVWEVPMVMWQDLNGGRCSMGDACANPPDAEGVYKMILKNFDRHYTTNRAPFGLYYHAAWFTQPHHKEGFIMFLDFINQMSDVWIVTNWQALQWVRDPTPISRLNNFQPFQCNYQDRPKKCNNPKVCNLWHKSGVRYMRTCQPCPEVYPWTGKTGIRSSRIDNEIGE